MSTTCFHGKIRKISIFLDWKKHLSNAMVQVDLSLQWMHMSLGTVSHIVAHRSQKL